MPVTLIVLHGLWTTDPIAVSLAPCHRDVYLANELTLVSVVSNNFDIGYCNGTQSKCIHFY